MYFQTTNQSPAARLDTFVNTLQPADREAFLRGLNRLYNQQLFGTSIQIGTQAEILKVKALCDDTLSGTGQVQFQYASRVLSAFLFAEKQTHHDGRTLLQHLQNGERIYLSSYQPAA